MPDQKSSTLFSATDLRVRVGGREVIQVPDLTVRAGELIHLSGENGAGKTTLLRVLCGELPYSGTVRVNGHAPSSIAARQITTFVPTDAALLDDLTVSEWFSFVAAAWEKPPEPLLELAQRFGLATFLDAWPMTLSRGTRQKVALVAALGLGLPLTLLDEPFNTLDSAARAVLRETVAHRLQQGGSVILTTHGAELEDLPCRRLELRDGQLVERKRLAV